MNSKERVFAVLEGRSPDRVPTGFWMHFPPQDFCGENAVKTHLEYFEKTRTDICKVMTELTYPCDHSIQRAQDAAMVQTRNSLRSRPILSAELRSTAQTRL